MSQHNQMPPLQTGTEPSHTPLPRNTQRNRENHARTQGGKQADTDSDSGSELRALAQDAYKKRVREWWITKVWLPLFCIMVILSIAISIMIQKVDLPYVDAAKNIATSPSMRNSGFGGGIVVLIGIFFKKTEDKSTAYWRNVLTAIAIILCLALFLSFVAEAACEIRYATEEVRELEEMSEEEPPVTSDGKKVYPLEYFMFELEITDPVVIKESIIHTVNVKCPYDERPGPPSKSLLNGPYAKLCGDAHTFLYERYRNKYAKAKAQYKNREILKDEWNKALTQWGIALEKKLIPKALKADRALRESANRRLTAVRYREHGMVLVALGDYEGGLVEYERSIKYAVRALYTAVDEGKEYGNPDLAIGEIIESYDQILLLKDKSMFVDETVVDQINHIISAYNLVQDEWETAFFDENLAG